MRATACPKRAAVQLIKIWKKSDAQRGLWPVAGQFRILAIRIRSRLEITPPE
jgi:hypothetical protein